MMMTWMVWTVLVAALLGASAMLAEGALRERGWATRWPWGASLAASVTFPLVAALRPADTTAAPDAAAGGVWIPLDPAWLTDMSAAAAASMPSLGDRIDAWLIMLWAVSSAVTGALLVGGLRALGRRAESWHRARVQGEQVLLSRDFGPALVGVLAPEIVLPRWALRMPEEDQRLACLHEAEHRAAHDTWLLLAGAVAVALMPWNVGLWWQHRRLRAAVELDCDARVLRRGASRRAYGTLLLELGSARGRSPLPVLALARSESLLERRLKMIVRNVRERRPVRALGAACLSAALFVVACETDAPTTVEEAGQATFQAVEVGAGTAADGRVTLREKADPLGEDLQARLDRGELRFFVDGDPRSSASDLDPSRIDRVEVKKSTDGSPSSVYVFTDRAATEEGDAAEAAGASGTVRSAGPSGEGEPLIYVDGIRVEGGLSGIDIEPADIERVEVLKGGAATGLYGPRAANGVVRITLKKLAEPSPPR